MGGGWVSNVTTLCKIKKSVTDTFQLEGILSNKVSNGKLKLCGPRRDPITSCFKHVNPLTPNDPYRGRIVLSVFFLQNAVCFIILTHLAPVLFTFYIQCVLKLKK